MNKEIKLDENWFAIGEKFEWTLEYREKRHREKLDSDRNKTGETEEYLYTDQWHYPSFKLCLKKYVDESLKKEEGTIGIVLTRLREMEELINNLNY